MALKWGSTYPTDIKYNNTRVDEVKWTSSGTTTTQWTRPVYSFTDSNWLFDYWFNVTVGYNDSTHRGAYTGALAFYGDTLTWNSTSIDTYINAASNAFTDGSDWDGEFWWTSQDSWSLEVNKTRLDNGTRSANSSMKLGWTTAKGTPPQFPSTASYPIGPCVVNDSYAYEFWVYASAQGNNAITWDAYLNVPAKAYSTTEQKVVNHIYTLMLSDLAYNNLQPVAYKVPIDTNSYYFVSLNGTVCLNNLKYTCSPSKKMQVDGYQIDGPTISYDRPARTISVSLNDVGYTGVGVFHFSCSRGSISQYLDLPADHWDSYSGWFDFSFTAHPLDTWKCELWLNSGWQYSSLTSDCVDVTTSSSGNITTIEGAFDVTTSPTGSIAFNVQPIAYTLTISKGTGVASTKTTITRGEAGLAVGASNVSNGTSSSYTVYYGDTYTCGGTASAGYNTPTTSSSATITENETYRLTTTIAAYTLTISKGTGVTSTKTTITRGTIGKAAGASNVSNGTASSYTVYYGDTYTCGGTASAGYMTPPDSVIATITGNKTHTVTTSAARYTLTLNKGNASATLYYKVTYRGSMATANGYAGQVHSTWQTYSAAITNLFYGDKVDYYTSTTTTGYSSSDTQTVTMQSNNTITVNAKPTTYALVMSESNTGVSAVYTTITRGTIGKTYAGASNITESMDKIFTCYYGDTYSITATVNTGYVAGSADTSGTITASKTVTLVATPITYKLTLTKGTGANKLYYKITTRGSCAPSGSTTHTTWQTYSSAVNVYYGDIVACYASGTTGYSDSSSSNVYIYGDVTQSISCEPWTVTLQVRKPTSVVTQVSITRGSLAPAGSTTGTVFTPSASATGYNGFTLYYGDSYTVQAASSTTLPRTQWVRKYSGTISTSTSPIQIGLLTVYTKPTITFAPTSADIKYNSANNCVYLHPNTSATVTIPADNPALKITRYIDATLYSSADSEIDYVSYNFSDTTVSDTSSSQTKTLYLYSTIVGNSDADYTEIDYGEVYMEVMVLDSVTGQIVTGVSHTMTDTSPTSDSQIS